MQRITNDQMQSAVNSYVNALMAHELLDGPLQYRRGSAVNGVAWSIRYADTGKSPVGVSSGFLGMTAREAYTRLTTLSLMLADISYRNESL